MLFSTESLVSPPLPGRVRRRAAEAILEPPDGLDRFREVPARGRVMEEVRREDPLGDVKDPLGDVKDPLDDVGDEDDPVLPSRAC